MPKRIIDGEALWRSEKLKKVSLEYRAEYANLLALAEANGVFEANPHIIWLEVYAFNRPDILPEMVVHILDEYENAGMLYRWTENGKNWGYWIGIGTRLPSVSQMKRKDYSIKKGTPDPPEDISHGIPMGISGNPNVGIGLGLGIGLGRGVGLGAAAAALAPEENMSLRSEIQTECLRVLGIQAPRTGHPIWAEFKPFEEVYGADAVVEAFKEWANENVGENINYPVSAFIRVAARYLRPDLKKETNPELDPLIVDMVQFSGLGFDKAQVREIGKMLENFTSKEILVAFKEFYAKLDEFQSKNAAKKFVETAPYLMIATRKTKAEYEQTRKQMEIAGVKLEAEMAAKRAENEAAEAAGKTFDPLFDEEPQKG